MQLMSDENKCKSGCTRSGVSFRRQKTVSHTASNTFLDGLDGKDGIPFQLVSGFGPVFVGFNKCLYRVQYVDGSNCVLLWHHHVSNDAVLQSDGSIVQKGPLRRGKPKRIQVPDEWLPMYFRKLKTLSYHFVFSTNELPDFPFYTDVGREK